MDISDVNIILQTIHYLLFIFAALAIASYIVLAIVSAVETSHYLKKK